MIEENGIEKLPFVFVGDEAFPLKPHMMRPYPRRNNLEESIYNYRLLLGLKNNRKFVWDFGKQIPHFQETYYCKGR